MSLTNSQHDTIMRIYNNIQTKNRHLQENRLDEVYRACPKLLSIDEQIVDLSASSALVVLDGGELALNEYKAKLDKLIKERDYQLSLLGYPSDYLKPIYDCPICKDTGYVEGNICTCFKKKVVDMFYMRSNLKNIVASENFDTFSLEWYSKDDIDPVTGLSSYDNMSQIVELCHQFIDEFDTAYHNLFIYGATGVGKTFLSNCIAKELLDTSHSVIYLTAVELFEAFSDFKEDDNTSETAVQSILDCDLLIIDDLGTELSNSFTNSKLFYCLNERILKRKATIISTNLSLGELSNTYSERIMSRISSVYTILRVFGDDIRLQKKGAKS